VSRQRHYYGLNHLHYLTASTYRRARLFDSARFRKHFIQTLDELRSDLDFKILGYVLMPEHFHLLVWPCGPSNPSQIVQSLKERTAIFMLKNLRQNRQFSRCRRMLEQLTLPPTVHHHGPYRVWQRRFYDLNVWTEKKRLEKLTYMHGNPVKRGLVTSPDQWPWSSFRFYYLGDSSVLAMDPRP
jgi:putative transposase